MAINASDTPYTACHGDLTGSARELLSGDDISLAGSLEMPAYSIQYLQL